MAPKKPEPKPRTATKAPRSHIVREDSEEGFLRDVAEYFEKGYRPVQDMKTFASYDTKEGKWRTLYVMPLVHFEELKTFQAVPPSGDSKEEERMFG